jgi:hypothetical protein
MLTPSKSYAVKTNTAPVLIIKFGTIMSQAFYHPSSLRRTFLLFYRYSASGLYNNSLQKYGYLLRRQKV